MLNNEALTDEDENAPYVERYVAYLDILGFKQMIFRGDNKPLILESIRSALILMNRQLRPHEPYGLRVTTFSDNMVLSSETSPIGLSNILTAASNIANELLEDGILVRGGITRGNLVHTTNILFGSALVEAHAMDRSGAPPRIAVHPDVIEAVREDERANRLHGPNMDLLGTLVCVDPTDLTPMLNTLETFVGYVDVPDHGLIEADMRIEANNVALRIAGNVLNGTDPAVRAKWIWMAKYWDRMASKRCYATVASKLTAERLEQARIAPGSLLSQDRQSLL